MSWDADFYAIDTDGEGYHLRDWNFTHNTNGMINLALGPERIQDTPTPWWERISKVAGGSWWTVLDGMSGNDGHRLLSEVLTAFDAEPARYRAMNPENGWGDFDQLCLVLREMSDLSRRFPTGLWRVSG